MSWTLERNVAEWFFRRDKLAGLEPKLYMGEI